MKIALIIEPGVDGAFRYLESIAYLLSDIGHRVDLLYSSKRGSTDLENLIHHLGDRNGVTINLQVTNLPSPRDIIAAVKIHRYLSSEKPDIVHAHSFKAGLLIRSIPRTKAWSHTTVFYSPHAYYGCGGRKKGAFITDVLERSLGRRAFTIACSKSEYNYANLKLNIPDSYLNLLTTGTNIQRFKPIQHQEKIALRKRHSIPEESVVIGTVARVSKQKDVATLYKGFVQASQYNSSLVLLHIGAGPLPHQCQALLNDSRGKIIWINSLSPIEEAYQMMDVFALCSLYEGLSLSSIEAMASGLPLILTKVEGNVDILDSGANQCIGVEAQNAHEVMQAMLESVDFLSNTNNHCEVANDQFSDEDFTRRLLSLYESKTNND